MIRKIFKKSEYKPIEKINENTYRLMWNKVNLFDCEYQLNEDDSRVLDDNRNPEQLSF